MVIKIPYGKVEKTVKIGRNNLLMLVIIIY